MDLKALKRPGGPRAAGAERPLDLGRFLPFRVHMLATRIAMAPTFQLPDGSSVRVREWRVLAFLGAYGPLTNQQIARNVGMDVATITRAVQALGAAGLVSTRVSRTDRRKQLISLTEKGAAAHDHIADQRRAYGELVEGAFSPAEREAFYDLLDKLDARLDEIEEAGAVEEWEDE